MKLINKIFFIVFAIVLISLILVSVLYKQSIRDLSTYDNNFKALVLEKNELEKEAIAYKFSIEQLEYINDSILTDLNNTRVELGIKDNQIKQMQNIKTEIHTVDSVFVRDTIFRDNFVRLDTLLRDEWYYIKLQLEYPNKITINTKYKTDLDVFAYTSKEIVGVPKKCFVGRWFQKKHNIIRVEVNDKNPHSAIKEQKFIIIE